MRSGIARIGACGLLAVLGAVVGAPAQAHPSETSDRLSGIYIGAFAGAVVLDSTVRFATEKPKGGPKLVDQGGDGQIGGLRAGWGAMLNDHVYLGLEVEASKTHRAISRYNSHRSDYQSNLEGDFGTYGRLGWSPEGNSLIFVRAGVSAQDYKVRASRRLVGHLGGAVVAPSLGLGLETHLTPGLAARIDATHAMPTGPLQQETYRVTMGLSWRF